MNAPAAVASRWARAGRALLARTLGELAYEGLLGERPDGPGRYCARVAPDVCYRFEATRGWWGQLRVAAHSLVREAGGLAQPAWDVQQFFADAAGLWHGDHAALCTFQDEMAATVQAEVALQRRRAAWSADALAALEAQDLDPLLDGHLKLPASRGRLGWSMADARRYGPECGGSFQVHWLAVRAARCEGTHPDAVAALAAAHLDAAARAQLAVRRRRAGALGPGWVVFPVHPWQAGAVLARSYGALRARRELVSLGTLGPRFSAQQSLRTLVCVDRPDAPELKLALSVLNTSAWRGLGRDAVVHGALVSQWVADTVRADPLLASRVRVQRQLGGVHCPHPYAAGLAEAPYRHLEQLSTVWRESAAAVLEPGERALPAAALALADPRGTPLLVALARRAGVSVAAWLDALFETVTVPLYHLLTAHGVAVVAHGQNIVLRLRHSRPVGLVLKDFHGDVRLVREWWPDCAALPPGVRAGLARTPLAHLRHDFYTGHLVSVLRFVADRALDAGIPEADFYRRLAHALRAHEAAHPGLRARYAACDLFAPRIERVCLMRARLAIGYADAPARPQAALGPPLDNPLHRALHEVSA